MKETVLQIRTDLKEIGMYVLYKSHEINFGQEKSGINQVETHAVCRLKTRVFLIEKYCLYSVGK